MNTIPPVWIRGLMAAGAAAILNVVIFLIASAAGVRLGVAVQGYSIAVILPVVVLTTIVAIAVAGVVAWLLTRRWPRLRVGLAWAGLVFGLVSTPVPLTSATDLAAGLSLAAMHVIAGLAWFAALTIRAR